MNFKTILSLSAGAGLMFFIAALNYSPAFATNDPELIAAKVLEEDTPSPLVCLDCHREPDLQTNEGIIASQSFCYECHDKADTKKQIGNSHISLQFTAATFKKNQAKHEQIACISCHTDVARSPHKTATGATCLECHAPHSEGTANEPHIRVSCQACHFASKFVRLDPQNHQVKLSHSNYDAVPISLSDHTFADTADKKSCEKCHYKNNQVGAPAAVLPAKSTICIICHTSPLAVGNPIFGIAGLIFMAGIFIMISFWFKGSVQGEEKSLQKKIALSADSIKNTLFSKQFFSLFRIFIVDIVLERRILKESVSRWTMHSLIFSALLLKFGLSLFTGIGYYLNPHGNIMAALIDKNNGFVAVSNDLLGVLILFGIVWAFIKRFIIKPDHVVSEFQDMLPLVIIGTVVSLGFFLEGARILVTGIPSDLAVYSFIGYGISHVLSIFSFDWSSIYSFIWYAHGIAAALFVAYLPFGKMKHIFTTPLTYFIEEVDGVKNEKRV